VRLAVPFIVSMLTALAASSMLLVPEDSPAMETPLKKTEFHLVWEQVFDKKIEDVAWGETEDGRLYPKIIVFDDEVRFYDPDSALLKAIPLSSRRAGDIAFSENSNYVGIPIMTEVATKSRKGEIVLTIYTDGGEKHCQLDEEVEFDGSSLDFSISDKDGSFVETDGAAQRLTFRDGKAKVKREVDLFEGDTWAYERGLRCAFSSDGRLFAVLASRQFIQGREYIDPSRGPNIYVILFDDNGKEVWRKPLNEHGPGCLSISSQGKYILVGGEDRGGASGVTSRCQYLFDRDGSLVSTYDIGNDCKISHNEEYLVLAGKDAVGLIETSTGELIWSKQFSYPTDSRRSEWKWISQLDISGNGELIGVSSTLYRRRKGGYDAIPSDLILVNNEGQMVYEKELSGQVGQVSFMLNSSGTEIVEVANTHLIKFSRVEE